ncbi:LysR family transcriptional regulator [Parasulfitobacter algicola]|uniref:LysR family transcriptional regulator n=1 Tax=Parasulfitobacter algicola TaxID=2614809 RepID=A0ABX2IPE8_9RHOB|nr:LysR family transcriptional regulator [Sulfitobacter algicola]NSX54766.1 LysR family transcriptional regulator [Sulfitobacter algicola]
MKLPWDDLALFAAVARAGALGPAAQSTSSSPATLSRRMTALEANLGRRLFLRGSGGYTMTPDGRALLAKTEQMELAAAGITQWQQQKSGPTRVRISAGTWTALQLADNLQEFWQTDCDWVPEFLQCNLDMDIARREIDIGIRNRRPEQPWLAGRKTSDVNFAVYATSADVTAWIGTSDDAPTTPSARWVQKHHGDQVQTTANDPRLALAMAQAGIGRIVLPTFVGFTFKNLIQLTDTIKELQSEQWLVSHHEGRHEPAVRHALNALQRFLTSRMPRTSLTRA